jgi:hypothetical protein
LKFRTSSLLAGALMLVLLAGMRALAADEQPPQPAEAPATQPVGDKDGEQSQAERIRGWFGDLADSDPAVREQARVSLMGMDRRYLETFQSLVQDSLPLAPAQAAALRQIVHHVYLTGEPYETRDGSGFLGVRMQVSTLGGPVVLPNEIDPDGPPGMAAQGVVIVERMPGFVGSRMLQDGDVILGIAERRRLALLDAQAFGDAIRMLGSGRTVHLDLLRQGRVVRVPVKLDPRPAAAAIDEGPMRELLNRRRAKADAYWQRAFAPMLKEAAG